MAGILLLSIKKRFKKFILVFIQFLIGLTVLLVGIYSVEKFFRYEKNVRQVMSPAVIHIFGTESDNETESDTGVEAAEGTNRERPQYKSILDEIRKNNPQWKLGVFENVLMEEDETESSYLMCDRDALELCGSFLDEADKKQLQTYQGEAAVPVLISSDLAFTYKKGEIYRFPDETIQQMKTHQMKVIGVLDKDTRVCMGGSSDLSGSIKIAEGTIIGPQIMEFDPDYAYTYNLVCEGGDASHLETEFNKRGWKVSLQSVREEIHEYFDREKVVMFGAIGFSAILLILSVIGCVGTLLSMILSRKEEFGIYFSLGMRKKNLAALILGETGVIFSISYLVSVLIFIVLIYYGMDNEFFIPFATMGTAFGIMFVCAFLCVILPVRKMMQWQPVELLGNRKE